MKEFLKNDTITYNLMSFTGYKTLILFSLLTESPKSYIEVSKYFENHPYLREKISLDTLRVYINSFKHAGCQVQRLRVDGVSKYFIPENPFKLKITQQQKKAVIKIYKTLTKNLAAEEIISLDMMLLKLTNYIMDEEFINDYKKVSVLNKENIDIVRSLLECCQNNKQIVVSYNSPNSGIKNIEMITKRLIYNNNKLYVRARGFEYNQDTDFLVSRIVEIVSTKDVPDDVPPAKELKVLYKLKYDGHIPELNADEKFISVEKDYAIIEICGNNPFYINQRILEHGCRAVILEPEEYKEEYIALLKAMKERYQNDNKFNNTTQNF